MGDTTPLVLPADLPFPIKVSRLFVKRGDKVKRGDRMLEYTFLSATRRRELAAMEREGKVPEPSQSGNDMVGSWESPINGEVVGWEAGIKPGAQIERRHASKPVVRIEQPCSHPVQFNGMCGVCGADITNDDYMSPASSTDAGPSRYPGSFELAHDASGVTVSTNEAKRLETQTRDTLLAARKLSLIVDLDQTIIHTTVDPTVGEWLNECEEDAKRSSEEKEAGSTTTPPGSPKQGREPNPNAEALKDVARFQLAEDLPPGAVKGKGRGPASSRWYYTKPRPGLKEFLDTMSQLYEMHVYTMGTRSYADAICNIVDPTGKIFGGRILSRDESGSMSSKSLIRLFPTDQSMVVVIDDRSDVWGDCPNLVKVVPYDFFIGIGDINSSFLPPTQPTVTSPPGQASTPGSDHASSAASTPPPETPPEIPSAEEGLMRQSKLLDEMAESRPLAKLEKENDEKEEGGTEGEETPTAEAPKPVEKENDEDADKQHGPHVLHLRHPHHRKALLNPNDYELDRVGGILRTIHSQYYEYYDRFYDSKSDTLPMSCDTPLLIEELKDKVLQGCVIAFTGVIPRNVEPEKAEIWQLAESFGAVCVHDLSPKVTHLVTASLGTEKMYRASKIPGVKTVWLGWLQSCIALWDHEPEEPFLAAHPSASVSQSRNESPGADAADESGDDKRAQEFEWDDAAQAEFDAFMEELTDDDGDESGGDDEDGDGGEPEDGRRDRAKSPKTVIDNDETHRWSRASTPGPSILSRAPSPGRETPKAVAWADDENKPLEHVRETRPGDIVSFPPHKKRKVLMLEAPSDDDDIPEANRMTYKAKPSWQTRNGAEDDGNGDGDGDVSGESGAPSEDDDDAAPGEPALSSETAAPPDVPRGAEAKSAEADTADTTDALGRLAISKPDKAGCDK